jgi:dephospho-CoA kinase
MPIGKKTYQPFFSLGITGGIGSGKSTVAKMFKTQGARVIDTDEIAHKLTAPAGKAMAAIRQEFGADFVDRNGSLDRAKMRELVFQIPSARTVLENILHPLIKQEALDQAFLPGEGYVIFVVPLLAERPIWQDMASRILVVDCPEELQIERVIARSNMSREQVMAIMATQATREERRAISDDVILNDGDIDRLSAEVIRLDAIYRKISFMRNLN